MDIMNKKKFTKTVLDENIEDFVIHIISFNLNLMPIHLSQEAQIVLLVINKVQILFKYLDFSDIFSKKRALVLLEITNLN